MPNGSQFDLIDLNRPDSPTSFTQAVDVTKRAIDAGYSSKLALAVQKRVMKAIQRTPDRAHELVKLGEKIIEKGTAAAPVMLGGGDPFANIDIDVAFVDWDAGGRGAQTYKFDLQALIDQWIAEGLMPTAGMFRP